MSNFIVYTWLQWTTVNRRLPILSTLNIVTAIWATWITIINWIDSHIIFPFIPFTQISRNVQSSAQHKNNNCSDLCSRDEWIVIRLIDFFFVCVWVMHVNRMETNKLKIEQSPLSCNSVCIARLIAFTKPVIKSHIHRLEKWIIMRCDTTSHSSVYPFRLVCFRLIWPKSAHHTFG